MVVCDKEKLDEKGCHGAPDFVVEVASESTKYKDFVIKLNKYMTAGVKEYWIVDPDTRKTHIYSLKDGTFALSDYGFDETVTGVLCPDLEVIMEKLL